MLVVSHGGVILALWGAIAPGSPAAPDPDRIAELLDLRAGARRRRVADRRGVTSRRRRRGSRPGAARSTVLRASWREADGFCPPNPEVYPHQWLWDSCFHAIAWSALGDGGRGVRELTSCLDGQLDSGFVPHMRYLGPSANRGPLTDRSSFTQPPIYAHAARVLARGWQPPGRRPRRQDRSGARLAVAAPSDARGADLRRAPLGDRYRRLPALGRLGVPARLRPRRLQRLRPGAGRRDLLRQHRCGCLVALVRERARVVQRALRPRRAGVRGPHRRRPVARAGRGAGRGGRRPALGRARGALDRPAADRRRTAMPRPDARRDPGRAGDRRCRRRPSGRSPS